MKRPDDWWLSLFQRIYGKEGNPEEIKQFKKSYYVPDWKGWGGKREKIKESTTQ